MADSVKNDKNVVERFPYKILNDLAKKLKTAEDLLIQERKFYETKLAKILADNESNRYERAHSATVVNNVQTEVPCDASKDALVDEISKLKQEVAKLVHENNRYHLALSNCHCSTLDDAISDVPAESLESIRASTHTLVLSFAKLSFSSEVKLSPSFGVRFN